MNVIVSCKKHENLVLNKEVSEKKVGINDIFVPFRSHQNKTLIGRDSPVITGIMILTTVLCVCPTPFTFMAMNIWEHHLDLS